MSFFDLDPELDSDPDLEISVNPDSDAKTHLRSTTLVENLTGHANIYPIVIYLFLRENLLHIPLFFLLK